MIFEPPFSLLTKVNFGLNALIAELSLNFSWIGSQSIHLANWNSTFFAYFFTVTLIQVLC